MTWREYDGRSDKWRWQRASGRADEGGIQLCAHYPRCMNRIYTPHRGLCQDCVGRNDMECARNGGGCSSSHRQQYENHVRYDGAEGNRDGRAIGRDENDRGRKDVDMAGRGGTHTQSSWNGKAMQIEMEVRKALLAKVDIESKHLTTIHYIDVIWKLMVSRQDEAPSLAADMWLWLRVMLSRLATLSAEARGQNEFFMELVTAWADKVQYDQVSHRLSDGGEAMDKFTRNGRNGFRDWAADEVVIGEFTTYVEMVIEKTWPKLGELTWDIMKYHDDMTARIKDIGVDVHKKPDHKDIRGPREGDEGDKGGIIYRKYINLLPKEWHVKFERDRKTEERKSKNTTTLTDLWQIAQTLSSASANIAARGQRREGRRDGSLHMMTGHYEENEREHWSEINFVERTPYTPCRECSDRNGTPASHPESRCLQTHGRK